MLFLIGLAKKAVLADTFKTVFEEISAISASNLSVPMAWIGCITYAFEIYYDFSGYSDMAIGLSRMFGFELKKNFDHPYVSRSVTEFWRRWHISLCCPRQSRVKTLSASENRGSDSGSEMCQI